MGNDTAVKQHVDSVMKELGLEADTRHGVRIHEVTDEPVRIVGRSGENYQERLFQNYTESDVATTTVLMAGLTVAQDKFLAASLRGLGYKVLALDAPDFESLRYGKEFGNRGQCNPTYFTVGNLIKFLTYLRDQQGMSKQEIIDKYLFFTAGACGPCRFGTYVTEYRKALRDAGFEGFRVVSAQQTKGIKQEIGEGAGFKVGPALFVGIVQALLVGDVLNAQMYRIRPYEVNRGDTDRAIEECRSWIIEAFERRKFIIPVVWRCRKRLAQIAVDRSRVKPRVSIIGEFWAMTTEGDGNYRLQKFLEDEGAEVDVQLISAWMLYLIWQIRWDTQQRENLKQADANGRGIAGMNATLRKAKMWVAEKALKASFQFFAALMGLKDYKFVDMDELARISHGHYDNYNRGGEGHMEVGKLIMNVEQKKVNMTLSVKPFGCMPSSGVSDGVQSAITEKYPEAIYLPIETTGDGAVNVYSRIQMQLFKARQQAQKEVEQALSAKGIDYDTYQQKIKQSAIAFNPLHRSPHRAGCTAADLAYEVCGV